MLSPTVFREYDIRGVVDRDLTPAGVRQLARAFGTFLRQRQVTEALVGRDNRLSSESYRDAVVAGLRDTGINVGDIGLVITPLFYFARVLYQAPAGVMITGSHNPADQNGFKLGYGLATLYGEDIQEIRAIMERGEFAEGQGTYRQLDPWPDYRRLLQEKIKLGPRRLRVVVDTGNGTGSLFAPTVVADWGAEVIPLYTESDPTFPHHFPDPSQVQNLQDLQAKVLATGADLGLSFDGDADRLGVIDEQGNILWGDTLMALYWREILPQHPGAVAIIEVKCSQALAEEVERLGGKPIFFKTGHSLIKAKMHELGAVFTGEMSGHLFFADEYYGYDDALYAAGRLLRILSHASEALSDLTSDLPRYPSTPETRVDCADEAKFQVVAAVTEAYRARYPVIDVDGVRVLFPEGWGLIRASNTQPVLVLRAEAKTPAALSRIKADLEQSLSGFPGVGHIDW